MGDEQCPRWLHSKRKASSSEDLCFSTLRNSHTAFWHSSLQQEWNFHSHHQITHQHWCLAISCSVLRLFFWKLRLTKSNNASSCAEESLSHVLTRFILSDVRDKSKYVFFIWNCECGGIMTYLGPVRLIACPRFHLLVDHLLVKD